MNSIPSTSPPDELKAEPLAVEEPVSRRRIHHVWEEAPHSHDRFIKWVGWAMGAVLFGIILCLLIKMFVPSLA